MTRTNTPPRIARWTWALFAILALALFLYVAFFRTKAAGGPIGKKHPDAGKTLGKIELEPLTEGSRPIGNPELIGKVVLLEYWGPRCPPCRRELPELIEIAQQHRDRPDFLFLPVACPLENTSDELEHLREETESFLAHIRATPPTYQLPQATLDASAVQSLMEMQVTVLPTTLIIDRRGIIRGKWQDFKTGYENQIADLLVEVLNEKIGSGMSNK